jgi:hypothetical protein
MLAIEAFELDQEPPGVVLESCKVELTQTAFAGNPTPGAGELMAATTGFATTVNEGATVVVPQLFVTAKEIAGVPEVLKDIFGGLGMFKALEVVPPGKVHK